MYTHTTLEPGTCLAEVGIIPANMVPLVWSSMLPIIEERGACLLGVWSEEEVFRLLCNGTLDLWGGYRQGSMDGFALCGWEVHDRAKYYHVLHLLGDNLSMYLDEGLQKMERWAYTLGAREIIVDGRPAWKRLLAKRGYGMPTVKLRKNLPKAWGN